MLGDELKDGGGWVVRLYFNPLVRLIWLGAIVMALGGALSLSDRRLRIGAPRRARRAAALARGVTGNGRKRQRRRLGRPARRRRG